MTKGNILFYIVFFVILYFYMAFIIFLKIMLDSLMFALVGRITSFLLKIPFKFKSMFNIAIHALTLPLLLYLVYFIINVLTGFEIKYFSIMYSAISYIYIITAILLIKAEIIKQQIELNQILEEQKKIREEYEINNTNSKEIDKDVKDEENKED